MDWHFASVSFSKTKYASVKNIEISCNYDYSTGTVYFDDIQMTRVDIETNLTEEDFNDTFENESDNDENIEDPTGDVPAFEEYVDEYGNVLTETTFADDESGTIYRAFGYDENGNNLISETDARGNVTRYTVDSQTSKNLEVVDRCGNRTSYEYDDAGRMKKVSTKNAQDSTLAAVQYGYDDFGNLGRIQRGDGMHYVMQYDGFHNLQSIHAGLNATPLVEYTHKENNGRLKQVTYRNGDNMHITYNSMGQVAAEKWYNSFGLLKAHYRYVYDGDGNIVRSIDIKSKKEYTYIYDQSRIQRAMEFDITISGEMVTGKNLVNTIRYMYDDEGTLVKKIIMPIDGQEQVYTYNKTDDGVNTTQVNVDDLQITTNSQLDGLGRKVSDEVRMGSGIVSRQFSYHAGVIPTVHQAHGKVKGTATTQLISQIVLSDGRTLTYEYDNEERITKVIDSLEGTTVYTYDAMGQLLTERRNNTYINTMTYDNYGNIRSKNGITYRYEITPWKDLLLAVGNQEIEYDHQGNPVSYLGHTLTWEKGRQLKSYDDITYTYNANGIRTSKKIGDVTCSFTLDGSKILREVWGTNELIPLYDNEETVCGILFNKVPYFFLKNLQGDIIAIVNSIGETVVRYRYDAWGACTILSDNSGIRLGFFNPYRYRGYYYDRESNLYYLQSRYYDPIVGRFINADIPDMIGLVGETSHTNLFAICKNNVVNSRDFHGSFDIISLLSLIGDSLGFIKSIGETAVESEASYKNLSKKIKAAKNKKTRRALIKEQKNLIKKGVGKGLFYITKIVAFIVLVAPYVKYIIEWLSDRILFVEFLVTLIVEIISTLFCELTSKLVGLIPGAGILLGFGVSWLLGKLLSSHFNDRRISNIAKYYNGILPRLTTFGKWVQSFGAALKI